MEKEKKHGQKQNPKNCQTILVYYLDLNEK